MQSDKLSVIYTISSKSSISENIRSPQDYKGIDMNFTRMLV